jgi:hypothetical protein
VQAEQSISSGHGSPPFFLYDRLAVEQLILSSKLHAIFTQIYQNRLLSYAGRVLPVRSTRFDLSLLLAGAYGPGLGLKKPP